MQMRTLKTLLLLGALVAVPSCKKDDAKKAREAASQKVTEASEAERAAELRAREADRKAAAARDADRKAGEAARAAETALLKQHGETRDQLQGSLDAITRKSDDLRDRIAGTKGAARKNAEAAATEVQTRTATVEAGLQRLSTASGEAWTRAKTEVEADLAGLSKAVDNLERTLE
jgi:hypothetical protein